MADSNETRLELGEQSGVEPHRNGASYHRAAQSGAVNTGLGNGSVREPSRVHAGVAADAARPTAAESDTGARSNLAKGLVREARPKQWMKNVLVLAVPFLAGQIAVPSVLLDAALAFITFSLAASGIYFVNDAKDVESDRAHPTKCKRPIAAGVVPLPVAYAVAATLLVASVAISALVSTQLAVVMVVYIAVQLGYCYGLKHQPVIDMCIVSSGFLLRIIAGGAAAMLPISQWFILVTAFGSLFMVAGKRYAEIILAQRTGAKIRKSLEAYSASYLRFVWAISAAIVIMTYSLWAYQHHEISSIMSTVSIVPFVIAILRYAVDVDRGAAGEPEEVVTKDKVLIVLGALQMVCLFFVFYT